MKYTFEVKDENYLAHYGKKGMKWGKRKKYTDKQLRPQPKVRGIATKDGVIYVNENDDSMTSYTSNKKKKYKYTAGVTEDTRRRLESEGYKQGSDKTNALLKKYGLRKTGISTSDAKKWKEERKRKGY